MAKQILLDDMPHMTNARSVEDDWAGISDFTARKKRQNRLNQRALRRRRNAAKKLVTLQEEPAKAIPLRPLNIEGQDCTSHLSSYTIINPEIHNHPIPGQQVALDQAEHLLTGSTQLQSFSGILSSNSSAKFGWDPDREGHVLVASIGPTTIVLDLHSFPLPADHLLTLVRYNLYRACATNARLMGLEPRCLHDDIISPFCDLGTFNRPLPESLLPTETQVAVCHHPYIDLFPFGSLRDSLIHAQDIIDEDELCADLGGKNATTEHTGLIVWEDPWDPMGWEVSEYVAVKWARLFDGCKQLLMATNYWRRQRGEPPLMAASSRPL
ncbi:hypothetical protein F5Y10DRAFT_290639 [Nemania abortiva]|nr:hypothetical protein F5Y10DRAFT_290639 [Nemania abortiva]